MATFHTDFRALLAELNAHAVEYVVVGAHALAAHGHMRATKNLDVWVRPVRGDRAAACGGGRRSATTVTRR